MKQAGFEAGSIVVGHEKSLVRNRHAPGKPGRIRGGDKGTWGS
ncbi:hypothetical protein C3B79_4133 [Aeromonas hydrophila]|nr:hypothetical protein C3B79_4133 [Aeromonas hydrophila]